MVRRMDLITGKVGILGGEGRARQGGWLGGWIGVCAAGVCAWVRAYTCGDAGVQCWEEKEQGGWVGGWVS